MLPLRIGIVGCGNISGIYFKNLATYRSIEVVACADLDVERARAVGEQHGVPGMSVDELLNRDLDLVLNITTPNAHAEIALQALARGKHVYNEKPLAISREDGQKIVDTARKKGLRVGGAPDTFLGAGLQTCRKLIDGGAIGEPVGAQAYMLCHGHEGWHPSPEFYYKQGGGPMFDMGPYYLTALVHLLGPIRRVSGSTRITHATRTITSEPMRGQTIEVETPTHVAGLLDFANGAIGEITTSFDVWHSKTHPITIYGSEGTLLVPDPNGFSGEIWVRSKDDPDWRFVPLQFDFAENSRGLGVLDIAWALEQDRPHRAGGELALHVLDVMHAIHESSAQGRHVSLGTTCDQPAPLQPEEFGYDVSVGSSTS